MARTIRSTTLETRTARLSLPISTAPVYVKLWPGLGLGYRRNATAGTWTARITDGKGGVPQRRQIGTADDFAEADGRDVLDYRQAVEGAQRLARPDQGPAATIITLSDVLDRYAADLAGRGGDKLNVTRIRKHISPAFQKKAVALIKRSEWRGWRDALANRLAPASVNRTCRGLKAALNLAADQDSGLDRSAWQFGLALIKNADQSGSVILTADQVRQIVSEARRESEGFGLFVELAAQTGARPSQLRRIQVQGLIGAGETARLAIPVSRKGKGVKQVPHSAVPISAALATKLRLAAGDRAATDTLLLRPSGSAWAHSDQKKPFRRAVTRAGQDPGEVTMYALRHSHIVRQILANVPIRVVAAAHDTSVAMIEKTYSLYIGDHSDDALRAALPDTSEPISAGVVPLHG